MENKKELRKIRGKRDITEANSQDSGGKEQDSMISFRQGGV